MDLRKYKVTDIRNVHLKLSAVIINLEYTGSGRLFDLIRLTSRALLVDVQVSQISKFQYRSVTKILVVRALT